MKKWIPKPNDANVVNRLIKETSIPRLCAEVLTARGIDSTKKAIEFIQPDEIESPLVIADMEKAAQTLSDAIDAGEKICIFGDYDCDGISSTAMLKTYLECIGADVIAYIPEREEGYGMNKNAIDTIHAKGATLIVTVDNGISAHEEAEYIYSLGMRLIITDHHQPTDTLPQAEAIVDPHRKDCPSKFKYLCGAGVVFKLIMAMECSDYEAIMEQFGDLVAIATIGDVVEISGENRKLVYDGLRYIRHCDRIGILALCQVANIELDTINSIKIAFGIVPRINASGRFGSPNTALKLLTSEDEESAIELAHQLCNLNDQRKQTENDIVQAINRQINQNPQLLNQRVLIFVGDEFHHGVIGIVASKFCEQYDKPCFVITNEGENCSKGSARGVGNFSIFECLNHCSDLLQRYGGHKGAGGFSLKTDDIEAFVKQVLQYANESFNIMPKTPYYIDKLLTPNDLTLDNVKGLSILEPFGEGNQEPTFLIMNAKILDIIPMANNTSIKFKVFYMNRYLDIVQFRKSKDEILIHNNTMCDFLVKLSLNTFKGKENITVIATDYRVSGLVQSRFFTALDTYEKFALGFDLPKAYYDRITPSQDDLKLVYSYIARLNHIDIESLYLYINRESINYCKLRICIDIFCEMGLTTFDVSKQSVKILQVNEKVDLKNSSILKKLLT